MDTQPYIKWLAPDGSPIHGGTGRWPLPTRHADGSWTPGRPRRVRGEIVPCQDGLHFCTLSQAIEWIREGAVPFLVQYRGPLLDHGDKVVAAEARLVRRLAWDDRLARHFACDCAARALTRLAVPDPRSVAAIAVARRFAEGAATAHELAAARAAAWGAAREAAWAAAWDAARAAARAAAREAAWAAANVWQGQRLWHYFTGGQPG